MIDRACKRLVGKDDGWAAGAEYYRFGNDASIRNARDTFQHSQIEKRASLATLSCNRGKVVLTVRQDNSVLAFAARLAAVAISVAARSRLEVSACSIILGVSSSNYDHAVGMCGMSAVSAHA